MVQNILTGLSEEDLALVAKLVNALKNPPKQKQSDKKQRTKQVVKAAIPTEVDTALTEAAKKQSLDKGDLVAAFIANPLTIETTKANSPNGVPRKNVGFRLNPETTAIAECFSEATKMRRGAWIGAQIELRYNTGQLILQN